MKATLTATALLVFVSTSTVDAAWFCGAGGYNCCPTTCCQPTACYTSCKVERQTCYRTVYETVYEPQQYQVCRTVYDNVCEEVPVTCYRNVVERHVREEQYTVQRPVQEIAYREHQYTVQRPVMQTKYREHCYTVARAVWDNSTRECRRTVYRPVTETIEREYTQTVMRRVTETINQERCYTVMRPVTTYRTVRRVVPNWTTQQVYYPGPLVPRLVSWSLRLPADVYGPVSGRHRLPPRLLPAGVRAADSLYDLSTTDCPSELPSAGLPAGARDHRPQVPGPGLPDGR